LCPRIQCQPGKTAILDIIAIIMSRRRRKGKRRRRRRRRIVSMSYH
jgi:hypothetical protein